MSLIELGQALSSSRRAAGLTQKAAAQSAGLSQGTVSRYESGDLDASVSNLLLLARTYNCTLSALVAGSLQQITPENITDIYKNLDDITQRRTKVSEVTAPAKATR